MLMVENGKIILGNLKSWEIAGCIATLMIVLALPVYWFKSAFWGADEVSLQKSALTAFVGTDKCAECHRREYQQWKNSHHDRAMEIATSDTVLGNFDNTEFEYFGFKSRFYRQDGKFFVYTQGPGGKAGDFEITHTFGWYPLQQYLVPFPGGRLQCLPIAWDVRRKRWYHLYPENPLDPQDWLYWTNAAQNWNGMCAECHSTNLKKNYDPQTDTYQTTWSDIDVGCEACHGAGSKHVAWAQLPAMARPVVKNCDLAVKTADISSRDLVELCAPCHSRRASLGDYTHAEPDLLDSLLPALLVPDRYYADGQILGEVYVYGSFTQSKMYHRDVRCSDCHDVHGAKLLKKGNALCLQCHRANEYNTRAHHFHKQKGEKGEPITSADGTVLFEVGTGAECMGCHMPGRIYMGIDYRPDHSFRLPRPDLSIALEVPNACNRCHINKSRQWADSTITKWYGPGRKFHYGQILKAGLNGAKNAQDDLIRLADDPLYPVIVRATAISLLRTYPGQPAEFILKKALMDDEALIRNAAIESLQLTDSQKLARLLAPVLYDPIKAVRMAAANKLAGEPSQHLDRDTRIVFANALKEFQEAMLYSGDFASSRHNLGNLYTRLNKIEDAIVQYRAAIAIDDGFYPAKVNLAMLYNRLGRNDSAKTLFQDVVTDYPEQYEIKYSLGLLLVEEKNYASAEIYLRQAADGLPLRARIQYNLGLLLQKLGKNTDAEMALKKALSIEPKHPDYLYAMAVFYLQRQKLEQAQRIAERMTRITASKSMGQRVLLTIKNLRKTGK